MSIRKVTICLAVILFISATVLAFTSNKRAEKKAEKEYTPTVQTVTMTAVGDCTLATDINADPNGSFKSVAESLNGDYSYFFKNVLKALSPKNTPLSVTVKSFVSTSLPFTRLITRESIITLLHSSIRSLESVGCLSLSR